MQPPARLRGWFLIHKWTSLACTAFLLLLCLTGLPLVFSHEIDDWLDPPPAYADLPADVPRQSLDRLAETCRRMFPGETLTSIFVDDDEPAVVVSIAPSWQAARDDPRSVHFVKFDARTGVIVEQSKPRDRNGPGLLRFLRRVHMDLFVEGAGTLVMAIVAVLFIASIVSGLVLYGPALRKAAFGTVRWQRNARTRSFDLHNLVGVVTVAWALVVGMTGLINEASRPLFTLWLGTDVQAILAPSRDLAPPAQDELASVQQAMDTVRHALPDNTALAIVFPGARVGSAHHYLVWTRGERAWTRRVLTPVLVEARTGRLVGAIDMPWYLRALQLSRPLHFGDYGGLPLKILWALLDLATIAVLVSGLHLWLSRRPAPA